MSIKIETNVAKFTKNVFIQLLVAYWNLKIHICKNKRLKIVPSLDFYERHEHNILDPIECVDRRHTYQRYVPTYMLDIGCFVQ